MRTHGLNHFGQLTALWGGYGFLTPIAPDTGGVFTIHRSLIFFEVFFLDPISMRRATLIGWQLGLYICRYIHVHTWASRRLEARLLA